MLVAPGAGGARLVALNEAARAAGLTQGELLSNARSKAEGLMVADADFAADRAALADLGLWCQRYTPLVMAWDDANGADGLYLEVSGSAHLFGGEAGLLRDLALRLRDFGLRPRLAIADTPGAAWAVSHFGIAESVIVPSGTEEAALKPLPLACLRLPAETLGLAHRFGLRRVLDVAEAPRAPLAKRLGARFMLRLDQALGQASEPLKTLSAPPSYHIRAGFLDPISSAAHLLEAAERLFLDLLPQLTADGVGVRRLAIHMFEPCGDVRALEIGLAAPSRSAAHIARLLKLNLDRLGGGADAELGYEAMGLDVLEAEPLIEKQTELGTEDRAGAAANLTALIDRLEQRLGTGAVHHLAPVQSHIPERSVRRRAAGSRGEMHDRARLCWERQNLPGSLRPLFLFSRPEPAEVLALIPEGPPRQFRWRGVLHQVARFEGPQRIAAEWWRLGSENEPERDYYVVEDIKGRRFWLYRLGRYGVSGVTPRWLMQGVFA